MRLKLSAIIALSASLYAGAASAVCQLQVTSEYHVTMNGNRPLVDASINGHPVRFMVDLGSAKTLISRQGAAELGLTPHRVNGLVMYGLGGGEVASETIVQELRLGNAVAHNVDIMILGEGLKSSQFVGLLGQDFLSQADIEFDFPEGRMRLIKPKGCDGDQVVYNWKSYMLAPLVPSNNPGIVEVYVALNGQKAIAQLDSGAAVSFVDKGMAERVGVTPRTENVVQTNDSRGIAGAPVPTYLAVFPSFAIGDEQISNAKLRIADMFHGDTEKPIDSLIAKTAVDKRDMLLGADFLRAHHVYVARSQGKMYFAYQGGPIFQVVRPPVQEAPSAGQTPAQDNH